MRKINIFTVLLITLSTVLSFFSAPARAVAGPELESSAALLVEADTGQVLYEKNKDLRIATGSLTRVMTLLLAVEAAEDGERNLNDLVPVSEAAAGSAEEKKSPESIDAGETLRLIDLMYMGYLGRTGAACNAIAEYVGGSNRDFTKAMNERAKALGCKGTHYANPAGAAETDQYTTAWDQYLILREAASHVLFMRIAGTSAYKTEATETAPPRLIGNANLLLDGSSPYYCEPCIAGKADVMGGPAYSAAAYARDKDMTLISVVSGEVPASSEEASSEETSSEALSYEETKRLIEWEFAEFAWRTLVRNDEIAAEVEVALADGDPKIGLRPSDTMKALLPKGFPADRIRRDIVIYGQNEGTRPKAPIRAGEILGEMTVFLDGSAYGKVSLLAADDAALDRKAYISSEISKTLSLFWVKLIIAVLVLGVAGYVALVVRDIKRRIDRKRKIAEIRKRLAEGRKKKSEDELRLEEAGERINSCNTKERITVRSEETLTTARPPK
jgi:D-alanyl-D-alanine carboxypeptidase (penicillin-binding protein 5/6)